MKKELKTLKDLEMSCDLDMFFYPNGVNTRELKAEAVKWHKKLKKEYWSAEEFCEHFFNLTEEDLEENENNK